MRKILLCATLAALGPVANAQWLNYRTAGTPVTKDGKVDLSAPTPHAADGHPDLTGVWHLGNRSLTPPSTEYSRGGPVDPNLELNSNVFRGMKLEDVPEKPEAAALRGERMKDGLRAAPPLFCQPAGMPINSLVTEVVKMVQAPKEIIVLYELDGTFRQIYTDGRPLPEINQPTWLGYSTAHWDGDTLVVESEGFNDKSWLDLSGHPHSESLHLTERYHRSDYGHMDVEMTFKDPALYSRPFTIKFAHRLEPESDIFESICNEGEKDRVHLVGVDGAKVK